VAFTALLDACVLYPAPLRDLLLNLACTGLFRARWSADIQAEWETALLRTRPDLVGKLSHTHEQMDAAIPDAKITGHLGLIPALSLPDLGDRHVLAAAIAGRADVIVTCNLKHFPEKELRPYRIEAQHPDVFISHVFDLSEAASIFAVRAHRASLKKPPFSVEKYLDTLARQELPETVAFLRPRSDLI
jgi:hypothetical protein